MKLATYQDGSRDGQLVIVSRDLSLAHFASGIATRLQAVLDDWNFLSPQLEELSQTLNHGKARHAFAFVLPVRRRGRGRDGRRRQCADPARWVDPRHRSDRGRQRPQRHDGVYASPPLQALVLGDGLGLDLDEHARVDER